MRGKLIVFEGIDGSGKSTQADLLLRFLKKKKIKTSFYKFPQYKRTIYGKMVLDLLKGKFGKIEGIDPYLAALPYAFDRAIVAEELKFKKENGEILVFDRYISSTKAHQASRLNSEEKREFLNWIDTLEYKVNKLPKEDLIILLDLPVETALNLIRDRKKDLLEKKGLQEKTRKVYLDLAKENKNWLRVNCFEKGRLKTRDEIHQEIVEILKKKKVLQ
jgi:dTMP kinase